MRARSALTRWLQALSAATSTGLILLVATGCSSSSSKTPVAAATQQSSTVSATTKQSTAAAVATSSSSSVAPQTSSSAASKDGPCPAADAVSSAAGATYAGPTTKVQGATTLCTYTTATGFTSISEQQDAGYSADTVQSALEAQAQALGGAAQVTAVSGLGDGAFEFTSDGQTTLGVVSGTAYLAIIGAPSPAAARALIALVLH